MERARSDQNLSRTTQAFGIKDEVVARIDAEVKQQVDEATEKCKTAPMPPADILTTDVYADGGFAWRN